jgi:hypothetical protein
LLGYYSDGGKPIDAAPGGAIMPDRALAGSTIQDGVDV